MSTLQRFVTLSPFTSEPPSNKLTKMAKENVSVKELERYLNIASGASKMVKHLSAAITGNGRLLVAEDDFHRIKDKMLICGNDLAVGESLWSEYGKMNAKSKYYAVMQKKVTV